MKTENTSTLQRIYMAAHIYKKKDLFRDFCKAMEEKNNDRTNTS